MGDCLFCNGTGVMRDPVLLRTVDCKHCVKEEKRREEAPPRGVNAAMDMKNRFWIHVVYKNPKDFPGKFVVRRQSPNGDGTILIATSCIVASTLDRAREMLHYTFPGLILISRDPEDDPVIVESWI